MRSAGAALLLTALLVGPALARAGADPLEVPRDPLPEPEESASLPPTRRIDAAAALLRRRGYEELPVLAWGLLELARSSGDLGHADRALELAPSSPGVVFEAGWLRKSPGPILGGLVSLGSSFPGLLWLATWAGVILGMAALLTAGALVILSFARTVTLHGHAIGHLSVRQDPAAWPGTLLVCAVLALLPLAGIGPALLLGAAGTLAVVRMARREALWLAGAVAVAGCLLGPPLDHWARLATLPEHDAALIAAWRQERGQPLPGDRELLERAVARSPDDPIPRLALATTWKRAGELDRVLRLVADFPQSSRPLRARAANLSGMVQLARGEVKGAIQAFERGRAAEQSAPVLFNLSRAHGRALNLSDQSSFFTAARGLDPELVSRYATAKNNSIHGYLIELPVPLAAYLQRGLQPSAESRQLAREIRRGLLGPGLPDLAWAAIPALAALGFALRRPGLTRCGRCMRTACKRCSPTEVVGPTCVRCVRLFSRDVSMDARVRRHQIDRDRARQRWLARILAGLGAVAPGAAGVFEGRLLSGSLQLWIAGAGVAAYLSTGWISAPAEIGRLAGVLPLATAALLVVPLYLWSLTVSLRRITRKVART